MIAIAPLPRRASAADACAETLRAAILRGEIAPGSRLPPERQLAASFGVNRLTLRAALAQLAAANLLSVRQGSGHLVRDMRRVGGPDLLPGISDVARRRGKLRDVAADMLLVRRALARAVLERLAARRHARTRTAVAAGRIARAIERFADLARAGADRDQLAQADLDIVAAILDATGSAVLGLAYNPIARALADLPELRDAMYAKPEDNVRGWRLLEQWMADRPVALIDAIVAELERRDAATLGRLRRGAASERGGAR